MAASSRTDIPWDLLITNFTFVKSNSDRNHVTDFSPCGEPNQGRDLNNFVEVLSKIIPEAATHKRIQYAKRYEAAAPDEIVISVEDALKIAPHLRRHHSHCEVDGRYMTDEGPVSVALCNHVGDTRCRCALRYEERRMSTFLHPYIQSGCHSFDLHNRRSFLGLEILKALLIYGDMETVLRICAHPEVDFLQWWGAQECPCTAADLGWDMLCREALRNFLGLGFIQGFAERRAQEHPDKGPEDFRLTRTYQQMVLRSTTSGVRSEIKGYRYKQFYGIGDGQFGLFPKPRELRRWCRNPGHFNYVLVLGRVPYDEFLVVERELPYLPSAQEVADVRSAVATKGRLPAELVDMVMGHGTHEETRALTVPHDPFHQQNQEQLEGFLGDCWQLLLRCDMFARALGDKVPWDLLIDKIIVLLNIGR
ncbi:hypothetical protein PG985_009578 [Apiospora marii]|uniref:uncharacterized protein n=1 Tax=Apiospora marii TaxID=335849 RepID=UPI003130A206